jgi:hypothetical protein
VTAARQNDEPFEPSDASMASATLRIAERPGLPAESHIQPEWCIDRAGVIAPMTGAELRAALDLGEVPPETRAWRLGMECWLPVAAIAELAGAQRRELTPTPEPAELLLEGLGPETLDVITPRTSLLNAEATTPAPAFGARRTTFGVASSREPLLRRPGIAKLRPLAAARRALTPVALGSAVGAAALALAVASLVTPASSDRPAPQARSFASVVSNAAVRAVELARHEHAPAAHADAAPPPPLARADRRPPREPGQRRLRVGARP